MRKVVLHSLSLLLACWALGQDADLEKKIYAGDAFMRKADYKSAVAYFGNLVEANEGKNDSLYVILLNRYGHALANIPKQVEADSIYREALELIDALYGEDHYLHIRTYNHLSRNLTSNMNFNQAFEAGEEALRIGLKLLGDKDTLVASAYNSLNLANRSRGKYRESLDNALAALEIWEHHPEVISIPKSRTYYGLGWLYIAYRDLIKALDFNLKALEVRKKLLAPAHPTLARSYNLIGRCYQDLGRYSDALVNYEKALEMNIQTLGRDHQLIANNYLNFQSIASKLGNYEKSIQYLQQAADIWSKTVGPEDRELVDIYAKTAAVYLSRNDHEQFLTYIEKSHSLADKIMSEDDPKRLQTHVQYAAYYKKIGDYQNQLVHLRKGFVIARKTYGEDHSFYGHLVEELAKYYLATGNYDESIRQGEKAIQIQRASLGQFNPLVASAISGVGTSYLQYGQPQKALHLYHEALLNLSNEQANETYSYNPPIDSIASKHVAIKIIAAKAVALQRMFEQDTTQIETLRLALETNLEGIGYLDALRNIYTTEEDKIQLFKTANNLFANAVDIAIKLASHTGDRSYWHRAFEISDRSKSFVLLNALNTHRAIKFSNIPDSLIEMDVSLKSERTYLRQKLAQAKARGRQKSVSALQKDIFRKQELIEELEAHIEKNYRNYFHLKYQKEPIKIDKVQAGLASNGAIMLEYFVSQKTLHIFKISGDKFEVFSKDLPDDFTKTIDSYRKSLTDYNFIINNTTEANELFLKNSTRLYKLLVKDQLSKEDIHSLIIIPDGKIGIVNFDALLDGAADMDENQVNYQSLSYLVKKYDISYTYSAAYHLQAELLSERSSSRLFAGFAPSYQAESNKDQIYRNELVDLPGARDEILKVAKLVGGDTWLGSAASEQIFKENANRYQINHLAMHGIIDDLNPLNSSLIFGEPLDSLSDNQLSVDEIYGLDLSSDLVVLSACESGDGLIRNGEGNLSISRAFNYAGSPSVVMSLWKTGDSESSKLMIKFYEELIAGESKASALQTAKLDYLNSVNDPLYSHPFFWAGIMLVGNPDPIALQPSFFSSDVLFPLVAVALLLIVIYLLRARRKSTNS